MATGFTILAAVTVGAALASVMLRRLVHCALCWTLSLAGVAGLYILAGAEFLGLAQLIVYVGAVAILIVFAILLTQRRELLSNERLTAGSWVTGVAVAGLVAGCLWIGLAYTRGLGGPIGASGAPALETRELGEILMGRYVVAFEVIGLVLTVALIGAVILALPPDRPREASGGRMDRRIAEEGSKAQRHRGEGA